MNKDRTVEFILKTNSTETKNCTSSEENSKRSNTTVGGKKQTIPGGISEVVSNQ